MNMDTSWWGNLVATLALEAAGISVLAWLALRVSNQPRFHRLVLRAAIAAWLCLWTAEFTGVRQVVRPWAPIRLDHLNSQEPVIVTARPERSAISYETPGKSPQQISTSREKGEPIAAPVSNLPRPIVATSPPRTSLPIYWPGWIWISGILLLGSRTVIGRLALGIRLGRLHKRGSSGTPTAQDIASIRRLERIFGLKPVRSLCVAGLQGPIAFGIWRPTIVLPTNFAERFTKTQREAIVAHELAHLASRDPLWLLVAEILAMWAWWHPAAHWLSHKLSATSEIAADQASRRIPEGAIALAEALVKLGRKVTAGSPRYALDVSGTGLGSHLAVRISMLLANQSVSQPGPISLAITAGLTVGTITALTIAPLPMPDVLTQLKHLTQSTNSGDSQRLPNPAPDRVSNPAVQASFTNIGMAYLRQTGLPPSLVDTNSPDPLFFHAPVSVGFTGVFSSTNMSLRPGFSYLELTLQGRSSARKRGPRGRKGHLVSELDPPTDEAVITGTTTDSVHTAIPNTELNDNSTASTQNALVFKFTYVRMSDSIAEAAGLARRLPRTWPEFLNRQTDSISSSNSFTGRPLTHLTTTDTNQWIVLTSGEYSTLAPVLRALGGTNHAEFPTMTLAMLDKGLARVPDPAATARQTSFTPTVGASFVQHEPLPSSATIPGMTVFAQPLTLVEDRAHVSLGATRTELHGAEFGITPANASIVEATLRTRTITASTPCNPGDVVILALPPADTLTGEVDVVQPREFVIAQTSLTSK